MPLHYFLFALYQFRGGFWGWTSTILIGLSTILMGLATILMVLIGLSTVCPRVVHGHVVASSFLKEMCMNQNCFQHATFLPIPLGCAPATWPAEIQPGPFSALLTQPIRKALIHLGRKTEINRPIVAGQRSEIFWALQLHNPNIKVIMLQSTACFNAHVVLKQHASSLSIPLASQIERRPFSSNSG